ncbi:polysaccharide deacetylase family protein [Pseudoduganella sp. LjRoot289]|uniref:DUF2334 domain-containing protein n=1 Tax=Pseudoduganella sp. LjRoot289 TaxID=3342314 RepID=UPI003ECC5EFD
MPAAETPATGPSGVPRALCVSIHDVAPATWPDCLRLWQAVRTVADIPLTWLVVPRYHGGAGGEGCGDLARYEAGLERVLAQGHELALHGYTHLDAGPPPRGLRQRFLRRMFTQGEGEFAALGREQARRKLLLGKAWFAQRGWPLRGFVAPAWLLGDGAWEALRAESFAYTTTFARFHWLQRPVSLSAPTLVYAARNGAGRVFSRVALDAMLTLQARQPLVRLSLHPRDARHPELLRHLQRLTGALLATRQAMTKAAFAETVVAARYCR